MVNVVSCFKYKKNNKLYVIYADVATKYEIIHYGSSHIKNNVILSMSSKKDEIEIIKEFIYKLINNEDLSDFERIDLTEATGIEIISSNNLEVKLEVIRKLEELTIPNKKEIDKEIEKEQEKPEVEHEIKKEEQKPFMRLDKRFLLILLVVVIIVGGGCFYLSAKLSSTVSKRIICSKESKINEINAVLNEVNTYNFVNSNSLISIDVINTYQFNTEDDYQNFTYKGTYYKYIPTDDATPSWDKESYTFKVTYTKVVDSVYNKPKKYEEVIDYYSDKGYSCKEEIEKQ